jgi:hypothetical protein
LGEVPDPPQLVDHDVFLDLQLERIIGVLPAAPAAADLEVRAGWLDPARRRALDLADLGPSKVAPRLAELYQRAFARQSMRDKDHPPIRQMADRLTPECRLAQLDGDRLDRQLGLVGVTSRPARLVDERRAVLG